MSDLIDFAPPVVDTVVPAPPKGSGQAVAQPRHAQTTAIWRFVDRVLLRGRESWEKVQPSAERARELLAPTWKVVKTILTTITPLGWTLISVAGVAWFLGYRFGWVEAGIIAVFCLVAVVLGALFTFGRTQVTITLALTPERISVGQSAIASFEMVNTSNKRLAPLAVRLPIGEASARFLPPGLSSKGSHEDWVTIPGASRGVILVGPVSTYRDDPWGLVRRELVWTKAYELFVHPEIVPLDSLGTGLLRDLEGQSTPNVSNADLAFHALRDYVPGDDLRHIHWKSSARLSSVSGEDRFMVRQFLDTRKTHIGLLSDLDSTHFTNDDEFEIALSCAASMVTRTVMDDMDLTILCGKTVVEKPKSRYALDCYSRAKMGRYRLDREFDRVRQRATDASLVVVVTGALTRFEELQRGRTIIPSTIRLLVIRVVEGEQIALRDTGSFVELTVGALDDLPRALRGGLL